MGRRIVITFDPGTENSTLIHRVRNFGEELYEACLENGWASISLEEIDRATTELRVDVRSKRSVRRTMSMIEQLLDRHGFAGSAKVAEAD